MKKVFCIISSFLVFGILLSCNSGSDTNSIAADSVTISTGKHSFLNNCSSCHNFKHNGIGPQLSGITSEVSVAWIKDFILDPKKVIESGDERARQLFTRYKTVMPSFAHLPDEEINAIIAYLHTHKKQVRHQAKADTNDIKNPIPDSIETSDLILDVEIVTQIPRSSDQPPLTRITKLDYQPNSGELFVLDIRGKLYKLIRNVPMVYMDMAALKPKLITGPGIATGFGSFAFHPEFKKNGLLYTTHAEPAFSGKAYFSYPDSIPIALQWVLTEWKTDPAIFPFSGTGREVLRIDMPTTIHGVQEIGFNPRAKKTGEDYGLLYIGIGDGGSAEIGQPLVSPTPDKVWGSIIRIDPAGNNSNNKQFGIPSQNPFGNNDSSKFARELYAYGFRNPHRFSWDKSGRLLAVNIGEHNIESVNLIVPGHFYGWPIREGNFEERFFEKGGKIYPLPSNDSIYHVTYPVAQYDHDEGAAIAGGYDYNGTMVPQLVGKYVFADLTTGRLFYVITKELQLGRQARIKEWNIKFNGVRTTLAELCKNARVEMRLGMDKKGEIYILTKPDGKIYKLVKPKLNT